MPERDFTDYIIEIHGSGERVFFWHHIRQLKKDEPIDHIMHNQYKVIVNKNRAFLSPRSRKYVKKRFLNPIKMIYAFARTKKVGLIKYMEPPGPYKPIYEDVLKTVPSSFKCNICEFQTDHERSMKAHITKKHRGAKFEKVAIPTAYKEVIVKKEIIQELHPYHMSTMHQPTGLMIDSPELAKLPKDSILRKFTPVLIKKEIEDEQYKKAVLNTRYGELKKVTQNWWIWAIFGIVVIVVFMVLSGNFPMGGDR